MAESRRKDTSKRPSGPAAPEVEGNLASSLYKDLHKIAARKMRLERINHTLQPTALVHEAYLKLAEVSRSTWQDRAHFLAVAARVMRHILVDHARSHGAGKRGAGAIRVALDENLLSRQCLRTGVPAVDEVLTCLATLDPRQAEILELHFFAGMTFEEIAAVPEISPRTAKRESSMARAWLREELSKRI
ncbi:MAG TPA: ECF-type sigma factor [Verrucomicrobiae bacterium]|jgi:RNA polymerase sigma-70 factor (ECF subfamily)|nr:ECF-type sigma factor [Verrucomicrobiae bacterium]